MARVEKLVYRGIKYRRYPESSRQSLRDYFRSNPLDPNVEEPYLHRMIWIEHHGPIPDGFDIHHIDEDPTNNVIENLKILSHPEHSSLHLVSFEGDKGVCEYCGTPFVDRSHSQLKRFCSSKCRYDFNYWSKHEPFNPIEKKCEYCGLSFTDKSHKQHGRFCSGNCRTAARRASGLDDETRICEICGSSFIVNKNKNTMTCSRSCTVKLAWRKRLMS